MVISYSLGQSKDNQSLELIQTQTERNKNVRNGIVSHIVTVHNIIARTGEIIS